jgi:hypothetical protein
MDRKDQTFTPYQPLHGAPYDLSNRYNRTDLALAIQRYIDKCEDYLGVIHDLHRHGLMSDADHKVRGLETSANLRRHRHALATLVDICGGRL